MSVNPEGELGPDSGIRIFTQPPNKHTKFPSRAFLDTTVEPPVVSVVHVYRSIQTNRAMVVEGYPVKNLEEAEQILGILTAAGEPEQGDGAKGNWAVDRVAVAIEDTDPSQETVLRAQQSVAAAVTILTIGGRE